MDTKNVILRPFSAQSSSLEEAVQVYTQIWHKEWDESYYFFLTYASYPDFYGLIALVDGEVVGGGFGTRSLPGQWWHDRVAEQIGQDHPALQDAWVLIELGLLPDYRERGIGTALHDALLAHQPCPRALLSTELANHGAQRLYERLGWHYLHSGFIFRAGQEPYVVMGKEFLA